MKMLRLSFEYLFFGRLPWRGDTGCMIDRFDVRAHLDEIPSYSVDEEEDKKTAEDWEERQANYERYRILVQNDFMESGCQKNNTSPFFFIVTPEYSFCFFTLWNWMLADFYIFFFLLFIMWVFSKIKKTYLSSLTGTFDTYMIKIYFFYANFLLLINSE